MSVAPTDVLVVGAGVSGLTTALCLARAGVAVQIVSDGDPLATTSAAAGAIWGLYSVTDDRLLGWGLETWDELQHLAETRPESGIQMATGIEAAHETTTPPDHIVELADFTEAKGPDLPNGYAAGWRYRVPVVEMRSYITFLMAELAGLGVGIDLERKVTSFDEVADEAGAVVNCTGLGARDLVPGERDKMLPVQGQLVVVDNPGVQGFFVDDPHPRTNDLTYFISHGDHVVLGGSWVPNQEDTTPDEAVTEQILARCVAVEPALRDANFRSARVGLRPERQRVRLEREQHPACGSIVHNYGHGGAGLTLSWGCANAVRGLLSG